jgi:hypothetical protein
MAVWAPASPTRSMGCNLVRTLVTYSLMRKCEHNARRFRASSTTRLSRSSFGSFTRTPRPQLAFSNLLPSLEHSCREAAKQETCVCFAAQTTLHRLGSKEKLTRLAKIIREQRGRGVRVGIRGSNGVCKETSISCRRRKCSCTRTHGPS